ncbi:hypothetical protein B0T13DRAFT_444951 [Neurospora crassa]|nr:hypothetical protein B0T13DRAFT_444951 [Neurospora crassa]
MLMFLPPSPPRAGTSCGVVVVALVTVVLLSPFLPVPGVVTCNMLDDANRASLYAIVEVQQTPLNETDTMTIDWAIPPENTILREKGTPTPPPSQIGPTEHTRPQPSIHLPTGCHSAILDRRRLKMDCMPLQGCIGLRAGIWVPLWGTYTSGLVCCKGVDVSP